MKTVLVIEGEHVLCSRFAPGLSENGWSILNAGDHDRALALSRQHQPQIILCDWQSPWSDIGRSCRNLDAPNGSASHRPILIAAGTGQMAEKFAALRAGADEYVAKSVDPQVLGEYMARWSANGLSHAPAQSNRSPGGEPETYIRTKYE